EEAVPDPDRLQGHRQEYPSVRVAHSAPSLRSSGVFDRWLTHIALLWALAWVAPLASNLPTEATFAPPADLQVAEAGYRAASASSEALAHPAHTLEGAI